VDSIPSYIAEIQESTQLRLPDGLLISFVESRDLLFTRGQPLPRHPKGMHFCATDGEGNVIADEVVYSVGGGFIVSEGDWGQNLSGSGREVPHPFNTASELLEQSSQTGLSIAEIGLANEASVLPEEA